jgi:UDP-N-acetyl-D-glucosamine dehydrogenase
MRQLVARGADVRYCDPCVPELVLDGTRHRAVALRTEEVAAADCVVVLTAHREFVERAPWNDAALVVDTRNAVPAAEHVWRI